MICLLKIFFRLSDSVALPKLGHCPDIDSFASSVVYLSEQSEKHNLWQSETGLIPLFISVTFPSSQYFLSSLWFPVAEQQWTKDGIYLNCCQKVYTRNLRQPVIRVAYHECGVRVMKLVNSEISYRSCDLSKVFFFAVKSVIFVKHTSCYK